MVSIIFLTIVDDFSRGTWTFLLKTKSNAFPILKDFLAMVEIQFHSPVKKIRSDNALELGKGSQEATFLSSAGIIHERSCVATPQQNGVVERKHRHLLEVARGLLFQYKLSIQYWGECILTATHLINRLPSRVLRGKTHFEVLFGSPPSYEGLRSFGCLCYVSTLSHPRDKFQPRAKICVFLGYPPSQKGYKVLDMASRKVFISRDVKFHEDVFPFETTSSPSTSNFPFPSHIPFPDYADPPSTCFPASSSNPPTPDPPHIPISCDLTSPTDPHSTISPDLPPRRSVRPSKPPSYLQDFICNSILLPDVTNSCFVHPTSPTSFSFGALSLPNQHIFHSLSTVIEPNSFGEASQHPGWTKAMKDEIAALQLNHIWDVVVLPLGKKPLPYKWVYKVKHNSDGSIERLKARLVVRGIYKRQESTTLRHFPRSLR